MALAQRGRDDLAEAMRPIEDAAAREAKEIARAEGWVIRTVAKVEHQPNGQWVVTLVVVLPSGKAVPA